MTDLDRLIEAIRRHGVLRVAHGAGLPYNTVKNVMARRNPTWRTMKAISDYLETQ